MELKRLLSLSLQFLVVIILVTLVIGQVLGQPILLSYVTTGSMEPTLSPGDGFVALPPEITSSPGTGDVIVFDARDIQGGGLTTHRIVGETDQGFITQGDNNFVTDQDGGEPHVHETEVLAVAWQPTGDVLVIPFLGTGVEAIQSVLTVLQLWLSELFGTDALLGLQGIGYLLFAITIGLYLILGHFESDRQRDQQKHKRSRDAGLDPRLLAVALTLLVVAGATAAMVVPSGTHEYEIVSAEFDSGNPTTIQQGTTDELPYAITNTGFVPTIVMLEPSSDGVDTDPHMATLERGEEINGTVAITTPPETGLFRYFVTEYRYLQLLPPSVIATLHDVHPWIPLAFINALIGVPFYFFCRLLLGTGRMRTRTVNRSSSWLS